VVQLDLGLAYGRKIGAFSMQGRLNLVNVLGRKNVSDWSLIRDEAAGTYLRDARYGIPFIPALSLRVSR
jgi:hypothetical protein